MSPKLTFTICSAVSFLFSISFYTAAEFFTNITFPQAEGNAVEVRSAMRYMLAGTIFLSSSMLFRLRHLTSEDNQKSVLFGTSIGFAVLCVTLLTLRTTGNKCNFSNYCNRLFVDPMFLLTKQIESERRLKILFFAEIFKLRHTDLKHLAIMK